MYTSQHYLSFAIVKVEEVIIKPLYYMLKIFGWHRFYVRDEATANASRRVSSAYNWILQSFTTEGTSLM